MLEEQVQEVLQNYQLKNEKAITFGHPKVKMNWILPLPGVTVTSFDQFQPFFVYFDESGISFFPLDMNQNYRAIGRSFLAWNDMDHFQFKKGLLQENGFKTGAVMVVNKTNIANLINEYKLFNSMGVGLKLNPIFIDGEAKQHVNDLGINPDEYVKHFVEFFRYWSTDKTGNINVTTCHELVNLILNEHSGVCTFNSCLGKWLCLDLDANIYPCDRLCTLDYSYGNVDNLSDISQIFESDVFYHLLKKVLKEDLIV